MLKPFTTERLAIRQLQIQDAPELVRISDTPAVSQWMAFMEGGFPLEKAEALIARPERHQGILPRGAARRWNADRGHGGHRPSGRVH